MIHQSTTTFSRPFRGPSNNNYFFKSSGVRQFTITCSGALRGPLVNSYFSGGLRAPLVNNHHSGNLKGPSVNNFFFRGLQGSIGQQLFVQGLTSKNILNIESYRSSCIAQVHRMLAILMLDFMDLVFLKLPCRSPGPDFSFFDFRIVRVRAIGMI